MTGHLQLMECYEYRIRQALHAQQQTFPNQKGQAISNPTARWVFQYFRGLHLLVIAQRQTLVLNLNDHHRMLLKLLGSRYEELYFGNG